MIIKIKHPKLDKTLLLEIKENSEAFKTIDFYNLSSGYFDDEREVPNMYSFGIHDTTSSHPLHTFNLNSTQEELEYQTYPVYAPNIDALIQQFIDTGRVVTHVKYKTQIV